MKLGFWSVLVITLGLAGCASAPPAPALDAQRWFADELFAAPSEPIDDDIFAPSEAMRQFLDGALSATVRAKGPRQALVDALNKDAQLRLSYDTLRTRTAAQAFDARLGNCLSLVIMTATFADLLGLPVQFNHVLLDESWSRADNVYFASGHVNLSLARGMHFGDRVSYDAAAQMTIDFLPADQIRGIRSRAISRDAVLAMYLNNRAAESLAAQRLDDAYWWARKALERVPGSLQAYNTLGVIYTRRGALPEAERVLRHALLREPGNTKAMFNLAQVLERRGLLAEAGQLKARLAQVEAHPPFHFHDLGMAALARGEYKQARELFAREVSRAAEYHEFHFGLALAHFALGELSTARKHLQQAVSTSSTQTQRELYSAKLDHLRTLTRQQ